MLAEPDESEEENMPELPEVEVTKRALAGVLEGDTFVKARFYCEKLRRPVPDLTELDGARLMSVDRRSKYLIWKFASAKGSRYLVTHLGMSGSWRLWDSAKAPAPEPHDRVDFVFRKTIARLTDPRKFSDIVFADRDPLTEPPLSRLGVEPLAADFTAKVLYAGLQSTSRAVKAVLLDGRVVVGCGNIYASESLFEAGISPLRPADRVTKSEARKLHDAIVDVLTRAVAAGGTTLHDFHGATGEAGWFALQCAVYGREGKACPRCGSEVLRIRQNGRSTFYCPKCQR